MASEQNLTVAVKVASKIDYSVDTFAQKMLVSVYKHFPILGQNINGITYAQIIVALFLFLFILFLRPLLVRIIIGLALKVARRTSTKYDERIVRGLTKPLQFSFLILGLYIFISVLYLKNDYIYLVLGSLIIINIFWFFSSVVHALQGVLYKAIMNVDNEVSESLTRFVLRVIYVVIWVMGISSVLSLWGINVTALVASLGLGGLAFALAAKDTAANLFGSIALLVDKSIKIGDWIKVDGVEGIVEDIGMRTTKIRTFRKSLIVVPNQIVANSHIENFSRRNIRRVMMRLGLTYNTTNEQIEAIIKDIKSMLKSHKGIAQEETLLVNFENFGDSAKEILVYAFTNTAIWQEYLAIREEIQYKIEEIVLKNGSSFAFPSQSLYIESVPNNDTVDTKQN